MTNKTEMVSVPLYATEEMKRAGMERMAQAQRDGSASLYAYAAVCWEAMLECYQESAAPAEDVRAVVDEPVAWRCGGITWSYRADAVNHAERFSLAVEPLYRHPQRRVLSAGMFRDSPGRFYNGVPAEAKADCMQCWRDGYELAVKRAIDLSKSKQQGKVLTPELKVALIKATDEDQRDVTSHEWKLIREFLDL